jgi:hypothetical protein
MVRCRSEAARVARRLQAKNPIWVNILEGVGMENAGIFYGPFEYFMDSWSIFIAV